MSITSNRIRTSRLLCVSSVWLPSKNFLISWHAVTIVSVRNHPLLADLPLLSTILPDLLQHSKAYPRCDFNDIGNLKCIWIIQGPGFLGHRSVKALLYLPSTHLARYITCSHCWEFRFQFPKLKLPSLCFSTRNREESALKWPCSARLGKDKLNELFVSGTLKSEYFSFFFGLFSCNISC